MPEGIKIEVQETLGSKVEETQKPEVKPEVKKEEPKYVRLEDLEKINQSINNTREYNNRRLDEINKKLESLVPKTVEPKPDDLDELVQKDWKAGVSRVVEDVLARNHQKVAVQTEEERTKNILEDSKRKVMEKHTELNDPDSEKTKLFLKVLDENPDYKDNPRGPLLAAYEMENRLNSHGNIESGDKKVNKETRARASSIPSGTSPGNKGGYTLTRQDIDFCRLNNINPENYKRYKGQSEARV